MRHAHGHFEYGPRRRGTWGILVATHSVMIIGAFACGSGDNGRGSLSMRLVELRIPRPLDQTESREEFEEGEAIMEGRQTFRRA
jgi:hypothetical protein